MPEESLTRSTDSKLDELVSGYFADLDLSAFPALMSDLEAARCWLVNNKDQLDYNHLNPDLKKREIQDRLSAPTLARIKLEETDRFVALDDQNQIKFNSISFSPLTHQIASALMDLLQPQGRVKLFQSGRNWYPNLGYMGWHTNSNVKGFRLYCSHAITGGASYFRYEDPITGEIITSWDKMGWNFRCFRTDLEPLWHCVYSETDRISFGYGLQFINE